MPYKDEDKQRDAVKTATRKHRANQKTIDDMFPGRNLVDFEGKPISNVLVGTVRAFTIINDITIEVIKKTDPGQEYYDNIK